MKKVLLALLAVAGIAMSANAQSLLGKVRGKVREALGTQKEYVYKTTPNGAILIDTIVTNLKLKPSEIYAIGKDYLENAYKPTRFSIEKDDPAACSISGKGRYLHYHDSQLGLNQYYLSTDIILHIDAREGRMRVSLIADKYSGECINHNSTTTVDDKISEFEPVNKSNPNKQIMYTKAFPKLLNLMGTSLMEVVEVVNKKNEMALGDDW